MNTINDLKLLQALPLDVKIEKSKLRIREWYEHFGGYIYISVSGGKDSQVLAHLVKSIYPDVPCVFVNTGLEWNSVRKKGIELADEVLKPSMNFVDVITKYGYPIISKEVAKSVHEVRTTKGDKLYNYRMNQFNGIAKDKFGNISPYNKSKYKFLLDAPFRISSFCCDVMKKNSVHNYEKISGNLPIIGTMASESRLRTSKWLRVGCNAFEQGRPTSQPLSFWTENDILEYIKRYNLDIAEVYGKVIINGNHKQLFDVPNQYELTGVNRTGCVFCMFGITQDKERFLRLKEIEPKKYDFVMRGGKFNEQGLWIPDNGLGYKFVIDWLNENGNLDIKY